jgi:hypothetical protein
MTGPAHMTRARYGEPSFAVLRHLELATPTAAPSTRVE